MILLLVCLYTETYLTSYSQNKTEKLYSPIVVLYSNSLPLVKVRELKF
jgi:hypothetical protein